MISRRRTSAERSSLLEFLRHPTSYPDRTQSVETLETHISWIFLTDRFVYKLKKPVGFDFLDFRTPELRHRACEQEVELNRRLSPETYLGVVPIVKLAEGYQLGGTGTAVDWLVKMRRLPKNRAMDVLIRERMLTDKDIDDIGNTLSAFFRQLPPVSITCDSFVHDLEEQVVDNQEILSCQAHRLDPWAVQRVFAGQLRAIRLVPEMFHDRVRDGRIVDGHGDLRPEHIYLPAEPRDPGLSRGRSYAALPATAPELSFSRTQVIDCIEFNPQLRRLDVLDELAFLCMECNFLGAPQIGGRILERYCHICADRPPKELLSFYLCYRGCVRAKVHALRAQQLNDPVQKTRLLQDASRYLTLADQSANGIGSPFLLIVRGLAGTGKSTLAQTLSKTLNVDHLQTDRLRRELYGAVAAPQKYGEGIYSHNNRMKVYEHLFARAAVLLQHGLSVILDGTFLKSSLRTQAALLARHYGATPLVIHCHCPPDVAAVRIARRSNDTVEYSQATPETYLQQQAVDEAGPPGLPSCQLDTTESMPLMLQASYRFLASHTFSYSTQGVANGSPSAEPGITRS